MVNVNVFEVWTGILIRCARRKEVLHLSLGIERSTHVRDLQNVAIGSDDDDIAAVYGQFCLIIRRVLEDEPDSSGSTQLAKKKVLTPLAWSPLA